MWNAMKLCELLFQKCDGYTGDNFSPAGNKCQDSVQDYWISNCVKALVQNVNECLLADAQIYQLNKATEHLYVFFVTEFCDVYLETIKKALYSDDFTKLQNHSHTCDFVLRTYFTLLAPIMPDLADFLAGIVPSLRGKSSISHEKWPTIEDENSIDREFMERVSNTLKAVQGIRALKSQYGVKRAETVNCTVTTEHNSNAEKALKQCADFVRLLCNAEIHVRNDSESEISVFAHSVSRILDENSVLWMKLPDGHRTTAVKNLKNQIASRRKKMSKLAAKVQNWQNAKTIDSGERKLQKLEVSIQTGRNRMSNIESELKRLHVILDRFK